MRCWQCGAQMSSDERYCPECFAEIEPDGPATDEGGELVCPGCGTHCAPGDSVCPACGSPLDDAGPVEEDEEE